MYTTVKGEQWELTPKHWRAIRACARKRVGGSERLFNACWRQYRAYVNGATADPQNIDDVTGWINSIASEKVNDSRSTFYIYGR